MTNEEIMRAIEQLHRQQQQAVVGMMRRPDDEALRQQYRETAASIRVLRGFIAKEKPRARRGFDGAASPQILRGR